MAQIPCAKRVLCAPGFGQTPGDLEFDSPLANFSSEAPDPELFIGFNFGWDLNLPNLGWFWNDPSWPGFCDSPISQEIADLCAGNQQLQNTYQGGYIPINPWRNQNGTPVQLVPNEAQSCPFTCPDGLPFVWTVGAGQVLQTSLARANQIAYSIACNQAALHYMCLGRLGPACLNTPYLGTVSVTAGAGLKLPLTFAVINGTLPPGLSLSPSATSADITGTPDTAGEYPFTIRVTDGNGNFMQKQYTFEVLGITNIASLPHPVVARPYSENLTAAGGTAPYSYSIVGGGLPDGLTLSTTGTISGTPTVHYSGAFLVTFQVTDSTGQKCHIDWNSQVDEPPGPDWTQLNWTAYQTNQGNPANSVSGSGNQANAFASLTCNTNAANVTINPVAASGVTYTGPQVNVRVRYIVTNVPGNPNNATAGGRLFRNGIQLGAFGPPGFINAPGTYDTDFVIPASVAATFTIDGGSNWALITAAGFTGTPMHLDFTWQIFNL